MESNNHLDAVFSIICCGWSYWAWQTVAFILLNMTFISFHIIFSWLLWKSWHHEGQLSQLPFTDDLAQSHGDLSWKMVQNVSKAEQDLGWIPRALGWGDPYIVNSNERWQNHSFNCAWNRSAFCTFLRSRGSLFCTTSLLPSSSDELKIKLLFWAG